MPSADPRVIIAGGGTGGHVFPGLALADALRQLAPGCGLLFVGSVGGLEQRVVPAAGYRIELLRSAKLRGMGPAGRIVAVASLLPATARAAVLVRRFAPSVVVGVGGYASAPVVLAAVALGVPVVLLEQNAVPGTVTRGLARLAKMVITSFGEAARYLPRGRVLQLGNPVRPEVLRELEAAGVREGGPRLLVLGGSQGARAVNRLVTAAAPALVREVPALQICHQTGPADRDWVEGAYREAGVAAEVVAFIDSMGPALVGASLVVGRSGATTLAELCAAGVPAVLIPYPHAADDHQARNAEELVAAGGAVMLRQGALDSDELARVLAGLLGDRERLERMGLAMRGCGNPRAAFDIASLLLERFG